VGKLKLAPLSSTLALGSADESIGTDLQSTLLHEDTHERAACRELLLRDVLYDLPDAEKARLIEPLVIHRMEVVDHWRKAETHYLGAARALFKMYSALPNASLDRLLNSFDHKEQAGGNRESALPFSRMTANRLITVARMMKERRFHVAFEAAGRTFDEHLLPPYTVTAALAPLDDDALTEAVRSDLINPNVGRRQVEEFVRRKRSAGAQPNKLEATRELAKVTKKLTKLYGEVAVLENQRRTLIARLGIDPASVPPAVCGLPATAGQGTGSVTFGPILDLQARLEQGNETLRQIEPPPPEEPEIEGSEEPERAAG
jgi:hypothetical protein